MNLSHWLVYRGKSLEGAEEGSKSSARISGPTFRAKLTSVMSLPRTNTSREAHANEAAALGCLDVLSGASALLARYKVEVKGLLPTRGSSGRGALERLMADLGEVLGTASDSTGEEGQQEDGVGQASTPGSPSRRRRAKRAKGQQQAGQAGQGQQASPSCLSVNRDPLSIEDVLERVMSFAEGRELLGRLSRVCRLWRRVSEGERLCLPVVRRYMRSALLGAEDSLHARLGGSARRCLAVYDAWLRPGRSMCERASLGDLKYLTEISYDGRPLASECGSIDVDDQGGPDALLMLLAGDSQSRCWRPNFSPASLGEDDVHGIFTSGRLKVRYCVMDPATGVTACIFNGSFRHREAVPGAFINDDLGAAALAYSHGPMPVTSRTYGGPPLQAQFELFVEVLEPRDDDADDLATVPLDRERHWWFSYYVKVMFTGQPGIYVEQFIRSRLAEEAEAMAANKKHDRRW